MTDSNCQSEPALPQAIILAAGKGTRMVEGDLPKVVLPVAGRPMVCWVVDACRAAGVERCIVIVGYRGELVRQALADQRDCVFVEQTEQLGTGHATQVARPVLGDGDATDLFVLAGDGPLIRARTLSRLLEVHRRSKAAATLATAVLDDPEGYGRIVRNGDSSFAAIVEQADATADQLKINEVNLSYYCFRSDRLFDALLQVRNDNQKGEYYLTDVPGLLKQQGDRVTVIEAVPPQDVLSINTAQQLAQVDQILCDRLGRHQAEPTKPAAP